MFRLRTFGFVGLEDRDGRAVEAVLTQPKRLALLSFLAAARPQGAHRRDRLFALFWPDLDEARARDALNQALRFLRQALGAETVVSRGAEDVAIDPTYLWCDAVAFQVALDAGRPGEAMELYRGEFLQGFFVEEAGGFEEWMERERAEFRDLAARGARQLSEQLASEGSLTLAMSWGRKALELAPDDERALRRLLRLHDRAGDRAGAFRAYEAFARRFKEEFGSEPSPETQALVDQLKAGRPVVEERGGSPRPGLASPRPGAGELVGDIGDRYRILRKLGAGGMATVYLAEDLKHDREVALKVLRPEVAEGLARERFVREIQIAGRLQHPNIVPLFDSGVVGDRLYYVMAHIAGETLRERLTREGRFGFDEVRHILREVAGALAYAHERGVIHRDIKPENILLIDRRAVLADFGIARAAHFARTPAAGFDATLTLPGTSLGTPAYMAPEQAAGSPEVDERADLYALGVLAYEMLTGRPPFVGTTAQEILAAQLTQQPVPVAELRPDTPAGLSALVMSCLQKKREARPASAEELLGALESSRAFSASPDSVVPARIPAPMRRTTFRRFSRAPLALLLILLAVGAGVLAYRAVARAKGLSSSSAEELSRIAVLYFDDATPDSHLRWLARGLTEDLIDALSAVQGLTVTSRNGVRPYEGQQIAPESIGRALNAGLLIDGTVGAVGTDSVALSVRLVEARTGVQLERETVTRWQRDPNAIRRDLVSLVEGSLRRRIGTHVRLRQERVAAGSNAAWEYVRRARELRDEARQLPGPAALLRLRLADSLLAAAEKMGDWLEPTLERSALELARAAVLPHDSSAAARIAFLNGIGYATRALQRSPRDPRALAYRGDLLLRLWQRRLVTNGDSVLTRAKEDLLQASALDPGLARAWYALHEVYLELGNVGEANLAARKALKADVFAASAPTVMTQLFYQALTDANRTEADSLCAAGKLHFPADPNFVQCDLTVLGWLGSSRAEAKTADSLLGLVDTVSALRESQVYRHLLLTFVLARAGLNAQAREVLRQAVAQARREGSAASIGDLEAYAELLLGNRQMALRVLEGFVAQDPSRRPGVRVNPWFRLLQTDSIFRRIVGDTAR